MSEAIRYTLGKNERLKSRKAIDQLFKQGQSFSLFPFRVVYTKAKAVNKDLVLQVAFSVSKRYFKKAVYRNRIKRQLREACRLQKNELQSRLEQTEQQLLVFILYTGNELPEHGLVMEKMAATIKRLQKIVNETPAADT